MRGKRLSIVAGIGLLALACLVALFVWDKGSSDDIAKGISVGGVQIGSLDSGAAEKKLQAEIAKPLKGSVTIRFKKKVTLLDPKEVGLRVRVASMVDAAVDVGRSGGLFGRSWRRITGGSVDEDLGVQVTYDEKRLDSWVQRYGKRTDVAPKNAEVSYTATSISLAPGRNGVRIKKATLREKLQKALVSVGDKRTVKVTAEVAKPKVTRADLEKSASQAITVDREGKRVRLWKNFKLDKSYTVAVGKIGYETPGGLYSIQNKQVNPSWIKPDSDWVPEDERGETVPGGDPENPLKERWMAFAGAAGFHGTDSLGSLGRAASHGCIRMAIPDVKDLFDRVGVGVPVYIG